MLKRARGHFWGAFLLVVTLAEGSRESRGSISGYPIESRDPVDIVPSDAQR